MRLSVIAAVFVFLALGGMYFLQSGNNATLARAHIVGVWQSTTDTKYSREFRSDGKVIERNEGSVSDESGRWTLFTNTMKVQDYIGPPLEEGLLYIGIAAPGGNTLFFRIESIDAKNLSLVFLDRGNTSSFTRVK